MSTGSIIFYTLVAALVVLAVVAQTRARRRDGVLKRGERRGTPADLDLYSAKQKNLDNARETLRNRWRGTGPIP